MMRGFYTALMYLIPSGVKRTKFLRKHKVYGALGEYTMIQPRKIPLYPERIFIGNNVRIASNVSFITHDVVHNMLNHLPEDTRQGKKFKEKIGTIRIGNNVFVGANTTILYDVTIGNNVIIGAGSVVTKDLPDNTVCAGIPCKRIGDFSGFIAKRIADSVR